MQDNITFRYVIDIFRENPASGQGASSANGTETPNDGKYREKAPLSNYNGLHAQIP